MAIDLITKAEYKAYMDIKSVNEDTKIDILIPILSAFIKSYCKQSFVDYATTDKVEVHNGGFDSIYLNEYPIISITSVELSTDYGQTYTLLTEFTDYVIDQEYGRLLSTAKQGYFTKYLKGYKVTYKAGYTTLPTEIKVAAFDLLTYYRNNDSAVHSNKAPGTNTVQIEYIKTNSLPANIARVLDMYVADAL